MKNNIKNKLSKGFLILMGAAFLSSCTDDFLKPRPPCLSMNRKQHLQQNPV